MNFTDTHTHLNSEQFNEDRSEMIQRAIDAGVTKMFIPGVDAASAPSMFEIEKTFPNNVFLMMGLHPTYVKEGFEKELAFVFEQHEKRHFYAVGEIGMDLYWDKTFVKEQAFAFQQQIQLAKSKNLPINIHCRDAFNETFDVLEKEKGDNLKGIFHCFTGNLEQAKQAITYNMKLGIGGVVTFKNGKIDKFLHEIPIENIVLETDAPYLAPTPFRGKRNESTFTVHIAEKLAEIYNYPLSKVAEITNANSNEVFSISKKVNN